MLTKNVCLVVKAPISYDSKLQDVYDFVKSLFFLIQIYQKGEI